MTWPKQTGISTLMETGGRGTWGPSQLGLGLLVWLRSLGGGGSVLSGEFV